jgi:hypothetical protein
MKTPDPLMSSEEPRMGQHHAGTERLGAATLPGRPTEARGLFARRAERAVPTTRPSWEANSA